MHIRGKKERGGGQWSKKRERAGERAVGERVWDKASERQAWQTKEKSITHKEGTAQEGWKNTDDKNKMYFKSEKDREGGKNCL